MQNPSYKSRIEPPTRDIIYYFLRYVTFKMDIYIYMYKRLIKHHATKTYWGSGGIVSTNTNNVGLEVLTVVGVISSMVSDKNAT
jgi:hypothetical protein